MARGARSFEHRQVLRGRMTRQLTPEEMLGVIDSEWFGLTSASLCLRHAAPRHYA